MKTKLFLITGLILLLGCTITTTETTDHEEIDAAIEETTKTEWTLETDSDMGKKFKGITELEGWIIYKPTYGDIGEEPHFHVSDSSIENLPSHVQSKIQEKPHLQSYVIKPENTETVSRLEAFNEENPATILVDELSIPMEGSPSLNLVKILQ